MPGKDGKRKVVRKARVPRQPKPPAFPCTARAWWDAMPVYGSDGNTRFALLMRACGCCVSADSQRELPYVGLSLWAKRAVKRAYYAARASHQRGVSA